MSFSPFDPFTKPQPPRKPARPTAGVKQPVQDEKKITRGKVLRFLFHPEFGQSLGSLKETHHMFLRLVANTFLQTGLIDASFQGLRDPQYLKLTLLIETAYRNLQFTREGMPRVLLFGAFMGSLAAMVFAVFIFAISLVSAPPAQAPNPAAPQANPAQIQQR